MRESFTEPDPIFAEADYAIEGLVTIEALYLNRLCCDPQGSTMMDHCL